MIKVCLIFSCCFAFVLSVRTSLDASWCHLDLTCADGPEILGIVPGGNNAVQGRPACPQTKYLFPDSKQTTNFIRVKTPIQQLSEVTICAWITPPSGSYSMGFFSYATAAQDNALLLWLYNNPTTYFSLLLMNAEKKYSISMSQRTHFCVTIDKPTAKVYVDGTLKTTLTYPDSNPVHGGGALIIGQDQDSLIGRFDKNQAFRGTVENMMLWYRLLSADEIRNLKMDPCACPRDWGIALTPDVVQIEGAVLAQPIHSC